MHPFTKKVLRPGVTTHGYSFLIKPKFHISENAVLVFEWEIKCLEKLPPVSIGITKIISGHGRHSKDFSHHFTIPDKITFPEIRAPQKNQNARAVARCGITLMHHETIVPGRFSILLELQCMGTSHEIQQSFSLLRK